VAENAQSTGAAPGRTFRLGDAFSESFSVFGRHFVVFFALAAIVLGPFYLMLLATAVLRPDGNLRYYWAVLTLMLALVMCPTIASGATTYGVGQGLRGRPVRMLETLEVLARRFLPIIGVAICLLPLVPVSLSFAAIVVRAIAIFLPLGAAKMQNLLGWLVMPPVILGYCIYFAAAPVCIAEQAGIVVSLSRSKFLTKGHSWQIFGAFMLIFVADAIVGVTAGMVAGLIAADRGQVGAYLEGLIASFIVQAIFLAFSAVVATVFYHQLRLAKEGGTEIVSVFD
jgi:hypothetical protein